jgi:3-hydroxyisobutyrate dehydrogenase
MDSSDPLRPMLEHARSLGEKDLALALELGQRLGIDLPMARFALEHFGSGLGLPAREQT